MTDYSTLFGDEAIETRREAMSPIGDFMDAIDEALKDLSELIVSNVCHLEDGNDVESDIDHFTSEIKRMNTVLFEAWNKERIVIADYDRMKEAKDNPWDNGGKGEWKERKDKGAA